MKTLKILDWPQKRFYSETHPFHRWVKEFSDYGLKVKFYHHHLDKDLKDADFLLIHSRYFEKGKNVGEDTREDHENLVSFLHEMRRTTEKLIWYDAADSTGSADFLLMPYVDIFLKKQLLKDKDYYTEPRSDNDLRIWLNTEGHAICPFEPCPADQLYKLKLGWNLGLNDYRYFGYKMSRLSNYLSYSLYPLHFTDARKERPLDLTFRGTIHQTGNRAYNAFKQRNTVLELLQRIHANIASGSPISKRKYWHELRSAKVNISPYGWGEVCYRDFETFIAGALLVKPRMDHLETYPDVYKSNETFISVNWSLDDLPEKLEHILTHPSDYKEIAKNAQEVYKQCVNDSDSFIQLILNAIGTNLLKEPVVHNKLNLSV